MRATGSPVVVNPRQLTIPATFEGRLHQREGWWDASIPPYSIESEPLPASPKSDAGYRFTPENQAATCAWWDASIPPYVEMDQGMVYFWGVEGLGVDVSVTAAKAQLTDLVRRAEAGEDVVLTRHGQAAVRLVPVRARLSPEEKLRRIAILQQEAACVKTAWPDAAHSADFLYDDETGMPA